MKSFVTLLAFTSACLAAAVPGQSSANLFDKRAPTPDGCRALNTDQGWPSPAEWEAAMPGVLPRKIAKGGPARADYRYTVRSSEDVEKAVQFAAKHNIRLTMINTGHDYHGRNDAPSGLQIDTSQLRGVSVLSKFEPTKEGAPRVIGGKTVSKPRLVDGQQAAVTFGVGIVGSEVNRAIKDTGLFVVAGASPTVAIAAGWGQTAGHSIVSAHYGLGVDQFLEFKVVTADGKLKIANKVSNPDLFWALRGGGGVSWGVVTEVTYKAHPSPKVAWLSFTIDSATASLESFLGRKNGSEGLEDAVAYMTAEFPELVRQGAGGFFLPTGKGYFGACFSLMENATESHIRGTWEPILDKMATFPGMNKAQIGVRTFPNYAEFFTAVWPAIGQWTGGAGVGDGQLEMGKVNPMDRYGNLFDFGLKKDESTRPIYEYLSGLNQNTLHKRAEYANAPVPRQLSPQAGQPFTPYTQNGDYNMPMAGGKFPMDSRLLGEKHLTGMPNQPRDIKHTFATHFIVELISGGKAWQPDDDVSVLPAWRNTIAQAYTPYAPPQLSADILRKIAPETGAYANEAYFGAADWKTAFWGDNYPRLSQVKSKWDPEMLFWATPGVNADTMEVREGRVCKGRVPGRSTNRAGGVAPLTDNPNAIDAVANLLGIVGVGVPYTGQNLTRV
ncbi:FAD-binding domain-containing protein [Aulographum hederae CBS 113979]|uniref:FAD-binding domain-containing protein n=1 Tax=Aulographum hederae CBS 113979 TaxID=1176131 RepID=A0A6G1GQQ5_9PEZI|nr:FAD-binding domain-containing protein [Aulographum hederae CBS 113979]